MNPFKFVHAADLHLDSPFKGLGSRIPDDVADILRNATFDTYDRIVSLCIEENVDALLIAGDVYDHETRSFRAQYRFIEGLNKLSEAGINSYICHGNHDPLDGWQSKLDFPKGCYRFGKKAESYPLRENKPEEILIHGISYPTRVVQENLIPEFSRLEKAQFNIGVIHANVDSDPNHDPYAPCTLDDLRQTSYDYWALGHVHTRKILNKELPTVVYPGNPQGRHINEEGPRGVYMVEVDSNGNVETEFRPLDLVRWNRITIDGSTLESDQSLIDSLESAFAESLKQSEGRSVVTRVHVTGPSPIHKTLIMEDYANQVCEELNAGYQFENPFLLCEKIEISTTPVLDREELKNGNDFVSELLNLSDQISNDGNQISELLQSLESTYKGGKVGRHAKEIFPNEDDLRSYIREAENIFLPEILPESTE